MICPKCHNSNDIDAITCDFCMATLPMSTERASVIKKNKKIEKRKTLSKSITKLFGLLIGLIVLVLIVVIMYIIRKH